MYYGVGIAMESKIEPRVATRTRRFVRHHENIIKWMTSFEAEEWQGRDALVLVLKPIRY
jgi:hypothetical protein